MSLDRSLPSSPFATEFVPKFLARREKAKAAAALKTAAAKLPAETEKEKGSGRAGHPEGSPPAMAPTPAAPPALSTLPGAFHKRYLMNFTVLSPEQQRAAQEAERKKQQQEAEGMMTTMRGNGSCWGRRGGPRGWDGGAVGDDPGKAALRDLARRGVLEREEVKAMLMPGPLQDFRGSVLQVI